MNYVFQFLLASPASFAVLRLSTIVFSAVRSRVFTEQSCMLTASVLLQHDSSRGCATRYISDVSPSATTMFWLITATAKRLFRGPRIAFCSFRLTSLPLRGDLFNGDGRAVPRLFVEIAHIDTSNRARRPFAKRTGLSPRRLTLF
jgi:hypothetical protein